MARVSTLSRRLASPFMTDSLRCRHHDVSTDAACPPAPPRIGGSPSGDGELRAKETARSGRALSTRVESGTPTGDVTDLVGARGHDAGLDDGWQPHETGGDDEGQRAQQTTCEFFHDRTPFG